MLIKHGRPTGLGHEVSSGPFGNVEHETFTCGHCSSITTIPHRADPASCGGMCRHCSRLVCPGCARAGRCTPIEARLEAQLARQQFLKQVG